MKNHLGAVAGTYIHTSVLGKHLQPSHFQHSIMVAIHTKLNAVVRFLCLSVAASFEVELYINPAASLKAASVCFGDMLHNLLLSYGAATNESICRTALLNP